MSVRVRRTGRTQEVDIRVAWKPARKAAYIWVEEAYAYEISVDPWFFVVFSDTASNAKKRPLRVRWTCNHPFELRFAEKHFKAAKSKRPVLAINPRLKFVIAAKKAGRRWEAVSDARVPQTVRGRYTIVARPSAPKALTKREANAIRTAHGETERGKLNPGAEVAANYRKGAYLVMIDPDYLVEG